MRGLFLSVAPLMLLARQEATAQDAAAFVPRVTVADSSAECAPMPSSVLESGEHGYLLRFGGPNARRVVSAVWDSSGHLRRYSDARGDLRGPPVPVTERGDRTTISIDFRRGVALLLNESHGRTSGSELTTATAALSAERLGPPTQLLTRLHTQCGAPGP